MKLERVYTLRSQRLQFKECFKYFVVGLKDLNYLRKYYEIRDVPLKLSYFSIND